MPAEVFNKEINEEPRLSRQKCFGWIGNVHREARQIPVIEQGHERHGESAGVALPRSLPDACDALERSALMRELFGDPLVDLFVALKRHESAERNACADARHHWDLVHLIELA